MALPYATNTEDIRHNWQKSEVLSLFERPFNDLLFASASTHRRYFDPNSVQVSTLLSIKTGSCPEDCKYCPQSAHYNTGLEKEPLAEVKKVITEATKAKEAGASRFCMGAAWRSVQDRDMPVLKDMIREVKELGLETCMTLGMAREDQLCSLKEAGLDYYNHNIDTSEKYYSDIISTRTFSDRLQTLENVRKSGLRTCCGGIVGMGESLEDRAEMLRTLANLPEHPQSVPINLLMRIEGTPFAANESVDPLDFVRMIAVARILMPRSYVRLSAGRESMSNETQALCFFAGANSIFYGDTLLTAPNPAEHQDRELFKQTGIDGDIMNWYEQGRSHIWHPYTQEKTAPEPLKVVATDGSKIILEDGRKLIDGVASWWSNCHGYNNPHIRKAMTEQMKSMPHIMFAGVAHEQAYKLAQRLSLLTGLDRVFFTDSGSTAVETAMKMAVQYWLNQGKKNRTKILSFSSAYHGDTMGCMSICDPNDGMHKIFNNYLPKQFSLDIPADEYAFSEFKEVISGIKDTLAAVIIEPLVQGAGGMKFHSADILAEIYRICKQNDVLFIADEVMTGFGRTGMMFACKEAAIVPDIMCIGKALTGGVMTLAAALATKEVFEKFLDDSVSKALMSGPTFMANPLACAAANASLDLFEQHDRLSQVESIETQLFHELSICKDLPNVKDVRVKGAIGVVELQENTGTIDIQAMRQAFIEEGVWVRPFGNIVYLMPAFTIVPEELTKLSTSVYNVLKG